MNNFIFTYCEGITPLPPDLQKGLKQKHIQTMADLDEYEEDNIAKGLSWLEKQDVDCVDHRFWKKLHKRLFSEVWSWAGEIRTHELNNPDFNQPYEIWPSFKLLEDDINFWLENESYPFDEIAARFHERIETIHPFANGNGRFGRILVEYFCRQHNEKIPTWGQALQHDPELRRKKYIDSLKHVNWYGDYKPLIDVMYS